MGEGAAVPPPRPGAAVEADPLPAAPREGARRTPTLAIGAEAGARRPRVRDRGGGVHLAPRPDRERRREALAPPCTPRAARPSGPRPKNGLGSKLAGTAGARPGARIQPWCEDEARVGRKGRTCRRWHRRGVRPPGPADERFASLHPFAARRPSTDEAFALAPPGATAASMGVFPEGFARQLAPGARAALVPDPAGWHGARRLAAPGNVTPLPLPPHSPEPNPVERVWLHPRERFLPRRVLDGRTAAPDAACRAWNALAAETGRVASLAAHPCLLGSKLL